MEIELSFVIPVYNSATTIGQVVADIVAAYADLQFEVVLVNDGSPDDETEEVCCELVEKYQQVHFLQLSKNFSEHNAVLAGMNHTRGEYVAVLDDDGQNPPSEIGRMLKVLKQNNFDVVYGRYVDKQHHWLRNLGSVFNDKVANFMLGKPPGLYLSSFKVMNRFLVEQIISYKGGFPYIDGLVLRATSNIGQIEVSHLARESGRSNYT
ncbi:MAG: glycosyltransferase family 2 protein, partial [Bdellovibrionales bacterium]|nr:glycosyltransferase family 2 protein [Bdellovibrionales bacterium]